ERLWIRTFSAAGLLKPASRILSTRPDSPGPVVEASISFEPAMPPSAKATTTKASQPKVAVFQWPALQRPMRAARLDEGLTGAISAPSGWVCIAGRSLCAAAVDRIVGRLDSSSFRATISAPTQVGGGAAGCAVLSARDPDRRSDAEVVVRR